MIALEAQSIRKAYGGVIALKGADFVVRPGSVHALLGENGAGKSTLVKIMTGAIRPDSGNMRLSGQEVHFRNTADAARQGVAVVAQELSLFPHLNILDNMFAMREPRMGPFVNRQVMRDQAIPVLEELGVAHPLHTPIADLSLAERQLVEIAKALVSKPKVLLLDEPTSALEAGASERLLKILRILRDRNVGVVYVSHILQEVMNVCDEVTVLRDGQVVMSAAPMAGLTLDRIVSSMLGKDDVATGKSTTPAIAAGGTVPFRRTEKQGEGLVVNGVSSVRGLKNVSFSAAPGEIVGLAGLAGSGPEAMLAAISGKSQITTGSIMLPGGKTRPDSFRHAIASGVAYVSGDRRKLGLMLDKPIWENITQVRSVGLARDGVILRSRRMSERATGLARKVGVKAPSVYPNAGTLSGGNQQKVVLAKWLDCTPSVILLDDPTRGVDIGAREEINTLLRETAAGGAVVVYLSTDLEELARGCDRVLVFQRGTIVAEMQMQDLSALALSNAMNKGE